MFLLIEDYQKLTPKEENDLNTILSQVEHALTNVEIFTDHLSSELQELEYVSQIKHWVLKHSSLGLLSVPN